MTLGALGVVAIGIGLLAPGLGWGTDPQSAALQTTTEGDIALEGGASESAAALGDSDTPDSSGAARAWAHLDPSWVRSTAAATGVHERALVAYAGAAAAISDEFSGCGLGWNTLAGIGFVESEHGSIDGSVLAEDGTSAPQIVGPALDGTRFDAIADTDGGVHDGDTTWDRAVGPMQFLPQTWQQYGRDADGDGERRIDQIDDAALGTAAMLCSVGGDLTLPENWIAAIDAYNPNIDYNNDVADAADHYALLAEGGS